MDGKSWILRVARLNFVFPDNEKNDHRCEYEENYGGDYYDDERVQRFYHLGIPLQHGRQGVFLIATLREGDFHGVTHQVEHIQH